MCLDNEFVWNYNESDLNQNGINEAYLESLRLENARLKSTITELSDLRYRLELKVNTLLSDIRDLRQELKKKRTEFSVNETDSNKETFRVVHLHRV